MGVISQCHAILSQLEPFTLRTETTMNISTKILAAMMEFSSKDITRGHLTRLGICDQGYLTVTDGHTLVRLRSTEAPFKEQACKNFPRDHIDRLLALAKAAKSATVELKAEDVNCLQFPPASQVVPKVRGIAEMKALGVSPYYLARMAKLHKASGHRESTGVSLVSAQGELDPILFELNTDDGLLEIVIMPTRI